MNAGRTGRLLGPRLASFYGAVFAAIGLQLPYWPVWLEAERHLEPEAIGVLLAAFVWPRAVAGLLIGHLSDRVGHRRLPMIGLAGLTFCGFALFALTSDRVGLFVLSVAVGTAFAGILPLGEASALEAARRGGVDYPRARLFGSLTFIMTAALGGRAIEVWSPAAILPLLLVTLALTTAACTLMPDTRVVRAVPRQKDHGLWRRPRLWPAMVAAALIQVSHAAYYAFASIHWREAGLSGGTIGWLWAEAVAAEVVLFLVATRLTGSTPPWRLLVIAGGLATLRWTATAVTTEVLVLALAQTLHAATFGLTHLAAMRHLEEVAGDRLASAQGLYVSLGAILLGLATPLAGWLYGLSTVVMFVVMAALSSSAVLGLLVTNARAR